MLESTDPTVVGESCAVLPTGVPETILKTESLPILELQPDKFVDEVLEFKRNQTCCSEKADVTKSKKEQKEGNASDSSDIHNVNTVERNLDGDDAEKNNDVAKIRITQHPPSGVGGAIYDGARELCSYLCHGQIGLKGKTVIELGSGTGVAGIAAAKLGAFVTITDLAELVPLMKHNVAQNALADRVTVAALDWREPLPSADLLAPPGLCDCKNDKGDGCIAFDYIIAAEISYDSEFADPLLKTIQSLCHSDTKIILSHNIPAFSSQEIPTLIPFFRENLHTDVDTEEGFRGFLQHKGWQESLKLVRKVSTGWPNTYIWHLQLR